MSQQTGRLAHAPSPSSWQNGLPQHPICIRCCELGLSDCDAHQRSDGTPTATNGGMVLPCNNCTVAGGKTATYSCTMTRRSFTTILGYKVLEANKNNRPLNVPNPVAKVAAPMQTPAGHNPGIFSHNVTPLPAAIYTAPWSVIPQPTPGRRPARASNRRRPNDSAWTSAQGPAPAPAPTSTLPPRPPPSLYSGPPPAAFNYPTQPIHTMTPPDGRRVVVHNHIYHFGAGSTLSATFSAGPTGVSFSQGILPASAPATDQGYSFKGASSAHMGSQTLHDARRGDGSTPSQSYRTPCPASSRPPRQDSFFDHDTSSQDSMRNFSGRGGTPSGGRDSTESRKLPMPPQPQQDQDAAWSQMQHQAFSKRKRSNTPERRPPTSAADLPMPEQHSDRSSDHEGPVVKKRRSDTT